MLERCRILSAAALDGREGAAFSLDWKQPDRGPIEAYFGIPEVNRELRVRTAIDAEKRRAQDEQLFAYESIDPTGLRWTTAIDLDHVPEHDRGAVIRELSRVLSAGLFGIGKTKAHMQAALGERIAAKFPSSSDPSANDEIVVQPRRPLCLAFPDLRLTGGKRSRTGTRPVRPEHVRAIYKSVWSELSGDALEFEYGFCQQTFAGGLYLHKRFRSGAMYRPWLLTAPGSVFVLRVSDHQRARDCLDRWLRTGLPISPSVTAFYALDADQFEHWKQCTWVPKTASAKSASTCTVIGVIDSWRLTGKCRLYY